jgi:uncharacterized protein involved in exopolysaccharide biosynthesis
VSIVQFLRIFWARRWIVVAATISSVIGALIVVLVIPPRWEAHSRVMLDLIKPDPLTGQVIGSNSPYAATQIELVKDYAVAGQVADQLGWLSDPVLIEGYQRRSASDTRDFRRWIAQQVIDRTKADLVAGSNILEITYMATNPRDAKLVADALMNAYVDTSVGFRRQAASRDADWFDGQAAKAKDALDAAAAAEAAFEKQTGVMLEDDKTDVDTARLRALAGQGAAPMFTPFASGPSAASIELAQVDAAISQASQTLGPNHPELIALRAKRAILMKQVSQERAAGGAAASAASAAAGAVNSAMAAVRSKVVGQADKIERLKELHAQVELLRDEYNKTAAKAADLRQEATIGETGLTVLGAAVTPQKPTFPDKPLIFGGSLGLGLAVGVLVGLLMELFARRVRGAEDLQVIGAPLLTIIPATKAERPSRQRGRPRAFWKRLWGRPRVVEA